MSKEMSGKKNLIFVADKIWRNWEKDREAIESVYNDLRSITIRPEDYAINGQTLSKIIELMTKQTAQVVDFYKIIEKNSTENEDDSTLSEQEKNDIFAEVKKGKKKI